MNLLHLAGTGVRRNPVRASLTVLTVATAFLLFGLLDAVRSSFDEAGQRIDGAARLQVTSRMSLMQSLPRSLEPAIAGIEGVAAVGSGSLFPAVHQDARNPIPGYAVSSGYLALMPELDASAQARQAFATKRDGALVGESLMGWKVGDGVCALLPGGGYAEQVTVPAAMLMPIPQVWTMAQAAAMPEVYLTSWVNLYFEAALQPGEIVLVHGGASGIGTSAIQLAKISGNPIIVTAGSDDKCAACLALGATHAVNYRSGNWADAVRAVAPQGVDVILDMVGADYLADNLNLLRLRGRLVFISTLSGGRTDIDIRQLMGRRLRLIGSVLRSRSLEEKVAIRNGFLAQFGEGLGDGRLMPVIDSIYPIAQANEAHARMAENRNIGKIVLTVR